MTKKKETTQTLKGNVVKEQRMQYPTGTIYILLALDNWDEPFWFTVDEVFTTEQKALAFIKKYYKHEECRLVAVKIG